MGKAGRWPNRASCCKVILPSTQRTEILAETADRLGIERITPDHHDRAELWMQLSGPEAFDAVKQALGQRA